MIDNYPDFNDESVDPREYDSDYFDEQIAPHCNKYFTQSYSDKCGGDPCWDDEYPELEVD